jgi:hypothetical protein
MIGTSPSVGSKHAMSRLIHALAAVSLLAGCAAPPSAAPVKEPSMHTSVTLLPERSVALGPNAMLRYDGVADSRCPPGVHCVWAGELAYQFTVSSASGKQSFSLASARPAFDASVVPGLRVALGSNPVPAVQPANATPRAPAPSVTLLISHQ